MKRYWRVTFVDVVVLTVAMIIVSGWLATHHEGRCVSSANCSLADAPD